VPSNGIAIRPLTFVQTYLSAEAVITALLEHDLTAQRWLGASPPLRFISRYLTLPLYFHWATSGYGAFCDEQLVGWMYLRGWYQVLYIEALTVLPAWRRRGVGKALLRFAEQQAREQRREWLGLTTTFNNMAALHLYESQGFERGHWRIMRGSSSALSSLQGGGTVRLFPLVGHAARSAFRHFARLDVSAGDAADKVTLTRFLTRDPYRQAGMHWLVIDQGHPVAYLNRHGTSEHLILYLASMPEWWGSPANFDALKAALSPGNALPTMVDVRLASSGHHEAIRPLLEAQGFAECPASIVRMFKHLSDTDSGAHRAASSGGKGQP